MTLHGALDKFQIVPWWTTCAWLAVAVGLLIFVDRYSKPD